MANSNKIYDICVIGGGINGAGIARDAAGRGLSVLLLEAKDLAAATSSASTKLIHGGLRYLEYYDFRLVRDSLKERERLLGIAPHIIWPMRFILPHQSGMRPYWMIRAGLFLYDHLARRKFLPASNGVHLTGLGLKDNFKKGFEYSDCWADDARLVALNAADAAAHGAIIKTYTPCKKIEHSDNGWLLSFGNENAVAKTIVNAAGPWVEKIIEIARLKNTELPSIRKVKGSHIIVKRLVDDERAFILQQKDGRIVFIIPYEQNFTLIGTTEEAFADSPYNAAISNDEISYLCTAVNAALKSQISPNDVVSSYSGVRALVEDGAQDAKAVTRDYKLVMHKNTQHPFLSVFGGKLTTYRSLSEKVVNKITEEQKSWTSNNPLPGGNIANFELFFAQQKEKYPQHDERFLRRLARSYGTQMDIILSAKKGEHFGNSLYESEVQYLRQHEFAKTAEDILWRRSKLGLHVSKETVQKLEAYLA